MRLFSLKLFLFFFLIVSIRSYSGEENRILISSSVDRSRIKIGDLIKYNVKVIHDRDIEVKMPGMAVNLGGFEIRDYEEYEPEKKGKKIITEVEYIISTFTTGKFIIPPLSVLYTLPEDSLTKKMSTRKIDIIVESIKPSEDGDIKDIKPPVEMPYLWWQAWGKWTVFGCAFLLIIAGYMIYRKKKMGKPILFRSPQPLRPPHETALEALDKLRDSELLTNGRIKEYYIELSEIIRHYFEGRYYIPALEMTSGEVLSEFVNIEMKDEIYDLCKSLLIQSDMAKFAKMIPSAEINEKMINTAHEIVNSTRILPVEEVSEKNGDVSIPNLKENDAVNFENNVEYENKE